MPLRVCLISAEFPPETAAGGVGTYLRDLATALTRLGHDVTVVSSSPEGRSGRRLVDGVTVVRFPRPAARWDRVRVRREQRLVRGLRGYGHAALAVVRQLADELGPFDVAEAALWNAEAAAWDLDRTPLVTRLVTPVFKVTEIAGQPALPAVEALEKQQCLRSRSLAAISRDIGEVIVNHYAVPRERVVYAPLGVPAGDGRRASRPADQRLLYVGRLEQRKGVDLLLRALPTVLARCPAARVDVVGQETGQGPGGSYEAWARRLLSEEQNERVVFHGFASPQDLERLYGTASVFVAPSRYESFGLVYLEAMRHSIPVIGTDAGGIPDVVDSQVGRLVAPDDVPALTEACIELLEDAALRSRLGHAAREKVLTHFTDDAMARRTVEVYESALGD